MNFVSRFFFSVLFSIFLSITAVPLYSQLAKTDTTKAAKPVYTASLGIYSGTQKAISTDVKRLMTVNPILKVKDGKGTEYKVVAFEVTWKRKELSEDLKSGKPKIVYYMVGAEVKTNQLPDILRQQINTSLQAGEEIAISSILYFDPKKKLNYKAGNSIILTII